MKHFSLFVLLLSLSLLSLSSFTHINIVHAGPTSSQINPFVPQDAASIYALLEKGQHHRQALIHRKDRLYNHLQHVQDMDTSHLYQLVGVQLDDFVAFESLVFGMLGIYTNTVDFEENEDDQDTIDKGSQQQQQQQQQQQRLYDYRSPALRLTYDFQLAIKASHDRLRSTPWTQLKAWANSTKSTATTASQEEEAPYAPHHEHQVNDEQQPQGEAIKDLLHAMLQEVSDTADQLENEMHQHNLQFTNGHLETVFKVEDDKVVNEYPGNRNASSDDDDRQHQSHAANADTNDIPSIVSLIDQDQNEYIMTRPADTTVIYEDMQFLHDVILILVISFVFGVLFSFAGLPAFFGYILAGILAGPSGYDMIKELIQTETLAQLGVVLIVFVLGLECSLDKLKSMWRLALGGATLILLLTVVAFILMGLLLGATVKEAVFVGACVSLSSTAVVVKVIPLEHLEHLYGLLVMQDVLLGFMLAIVPALAKSGMQVAKAVLHVSVSFVLFAAFCYGLVRVLVPMAPRWLRRGLGPRVFALLLNNMAHYHNELTLLGALAVCLIMSVVSEKLGLGMELGCFAAGVVIRSSSSSSSSSSTTAHEALLTVISPVRDLFSCLFFASIGLHIYPSFLASELILLLTLTTMVMGFKYVVTMGVLFSLKFDMHTCSTMSVALAQISEFVFVLASRAKQLQIISREVYYLLLAVTSLTLMATPVLWKLTHQQSHHHLHHHHHHHHADDVSTSNDSDKLA
ncbi:Sodium/hydrogen exchanger family-domain-containing protein [Absidia repens]|uniref:Sodium/hydrogen exchanger family-domain-containing protein n=1 Tax=Absidia repens TaxID=90262 RepID=A0A1X2I2U9_9FUNG|nr:Sodium/hydrogen exchanger family-domain-containing protein [Absidia repens]